jgi:hypothetical protein
MPHAGKQDSITLPDFVRVNHGNFAVVNGTTAVEITQEIVSGAYNPVFVLDLSLFIFKHFAFCRILHSCHHSGSSILRSKGFTSDSLSGITENVGRS